LAAKATESSGEEGRGPSRKRATENKTKGKQWKRRYIAHLDRLKRREAGRFELYRTVARDLASRAERTSLTRRDLDLGASDGGNRGGLRSVGRRTLRTVTMKVLHQEQMKLDDNRCPDHQPAVQSASAEARRQICSENWTLRS
jgi:hypothetical protein